MALTEAAVAIRKKRYRGASGAGDTPSGDRRSKGRRGRGDLVAAEELFDPDVGVTAVLAGAPRAGIAERPGNLGRAVRLKAAGLGDDLAVAGHDVAGGVHGEVLEGGRVRVGDPVAVDE